MAPIEEFFPRKTVFGFRCRIDDSLLETAAFLHHVTAGDNSWTVKIAMVYGKGEIKLYTNSTVAADAMRAAIAERPISEAEFFKDCPLL